MGTHRQNPPNNCQRSPLMQQLVKTIDYILQGVGTPDFRWVCRYPSLKQSLTFLEPRRADFFKSFFSHKSKCKASSPSVQYFGGTPSEKRTTNNQLSDGQIVSSL